MLGSRTTSKSALLNIMCSAAFKAAKGLIRDFGEVEHLQVSRKGPGDFVSVADKKSEKTLFQELHKARPDYAFLMEESGEVKGSSEYRWIIDPLDGTSNFLHGIPHFAISIGLQKGNEIIAGVIYDPIKDEIFMAEKGFGAFINDRRIRVSSRKELGDSLLATGIPWSAHSTKDHLQFQKSLDVIRPRVAGVRRFGAAALDLAYVAAGRFEGYWEKPICPWDVAAGMIIVKEAGGFISDLEGGNSILETHSILASNALLYETLKSHLIDCFQK